MDDIFEGAAPEYIMPGIRIIRGRREPCLVCGHPTGDCADRPEAPITIFGEPAARSNQTNADVYVAEDVYGDVQITPFTRSKVLLAAKGTYIPATRAKELGLL